jgi:hypothetical protein
VETVTYTQKTCQEFTFQIPDTWFLTETKNDVASYKPNSKTNDVVLKVGVISGNGTIANSDTQKEVTDLIEKNGYNIISAEDKTIAGNHAGFEVKYKEKAKDSSILLQDNMLFIDAQGGFMVFDLTMVDGTQEKYQPIYDAIAASIAENPDAAVSAAATPSAEAEGKTDASPAATEDSVSFREATDSYEAFFDEYVAFMQKYKASSDAASMLADYSSFLTRYADVMQKIGAIDSSKLSADDAAYYLQVMARIEQKLASIQ